MAKPQHPLLSFGARGTIADTLTFQKRGNLTIARTKPIPKDPRSPAQLAQRQLYRDAVAAWHALSPEEQQEWRGVCPGLTAYQCFMKSELAKPAPPPPPEEYTVEQDESNTDINIKGTNAPTCGQRLFISNRQVSKLGFLIARFNNPTGDVTFTIRKVSDKSLIVGKVLAPAGGLPIELTYHEVEFDTPILVDEEVRILIEHTGYDNSNYLTTRVQTSDVKANECWTRGSIMSPNDLTTWDFAYRYKYYLP